MVTNYNLFPVARNGNYIFSSHVKSDIDVFYLLYFSLSIYVTCLLPTSNIKLTVLSYLRFYYTSIYLFILWWYIVKISVWYKSYLTFWNLLWYRFLVPFQYIHRRRKEERIADNDFHFIMYNVTSKYRGCGNNILLWSQFVLTGTNFIFLLCFFMKIIDAIFHVNKFIFFPMICIYHIYQGR